jgi:hypothetical protein
MIQQSQAVTCGVIERHPSWMAEWALAVAAAVQSDEADARRRLEQPQRLVGVAAQAVLKEKGCAAAAFLIMKPQPGVLESWHA